MLKNELIAAINALLTKKLKEISDYADGLASSLESEGKSTAGDKHDTGRAMIHLEQEKLQKQLKDINEQIQRVKSLAQNEYNENVVSYGSFVQTTGPNFLMGVGLGKIMLDGVTLFCVGMETPIGKQLKGLKENDSFNFMGKSVKITSLN